MRDARAVSGGGRILQQHEEATESTVRVVSVAAATAQLDDKYSAKAGASSSPEVLVKRIVRELPAGAWVLERSRGAAVQGVPSGNREGSKISDNYGDGFFFADSADKKWQIPRGPLQWRHFCSLHVAGETVPPSGGESWKLLREEGPT